MRRSRLFSGFGVLVVLLHLGALGYYTHFYGTDDHRSFGECLYRTILIVTTVNEPFPDSAQSSGLKRYTIVLLIGGMGVALYTVSALAAWIIELDLKGTAQRRRQKKMMESISDHLIVCGGGETGEVIIRELKRHGTEFVVIEKDEERAEKLREREGDLQVITADATEDETLRLAGIERARGVITSLHSDMENLFVVISARALNPKAKIVARSVDPSTDEKLRRGGADHVVASNSLGADRMVSAIVRPHVVTFMDRLLRDPESLHRIEEVEVLPGSTLVGKTLAESEIGKRTTLLVLAIRPPGETFQCNPSANARVEEGSLLVVLGEREGFATLRSFAGHREGVF